MSAPDDLVSTYRMTPGPVRAGPAQRHTTGLAEHAKAGTAFIGAERESRARTPPVLAAIVLLAAVVRLAGLGTKSFWLDEAFSVALARAPWHAFILELRTREANMSLLRPPPDMAPSGPVRVCDPSPLGDRRHRDDPRPVCAWDPSRRPAHGNRRGTHSGAGPLHIGLSQDARSYTLAVLLVTCSTWAFVHVVMDRPSPVTLTRGDRAMTARDRSGGLSPSWWCALYVIASVCAVYAHFYSALVLVAQWISLLVPRSHRLPWRRLIGSGVAMAVLVLPLVAFLLRGPHHNLDWIADEIPETLRSSPDVLLSPVVAAVMVTYGTLVIVLVWLYWRAMRSSRGPDERWSHALLLLWLVTPIAIPLAISIAAHPDPRPSLPSCLVPAFALLIAWYIVRLSRGGCGSPRSAPSYLPRHSAIRLFRARAEGGVADATHAVLTRHAQGTSSYFTRPMCGVRTTTTPTASTPVRPRQRSCIPGTTYVRFGGEGSPGVSLGEAIARAQGSPRTWLVLSHAAADSACRHTPGCRAADDVRGSHGPTICRNQRTAVQPPRARSSRSVGSSAIVPAPLSAIAAVCPQR